SSQHKSVCNSRRSTINGRINFQRSSTSRNTNFCRSTLKCKENARFRNSTSCEYQNFNERKSQSCYIRSRPEL
ncbi:hypothetical protein ILUMI_13471, partial [Ignelater luminosus]